MYSITNFKLKMEEVKECKLEEVSLPAVMNFPSDVSQLNDIKKELHYQPNLGSEFSDIVVGEQESTSVQLLDIEIKLEAPDMKLVINGGNDVKLEPLVSDELHIKNEICKSPTDQTKEKSTEDQHFHCVLCNGKFTCKRKLQQHLNNHTKAKPFKHNTGDYKICGTQNCVPFKCSTSDYGSVQEGRLNQHMKSHTEEKPFKCSVCDYACVTKGALQQHLKCHSGEKPFKCSVCNYACTLKSNLQRHVKYHSGEKPFKCSLCDYACVTKDVLQRHVKHHSGEKPFKCSLCDYACVSKSDLQPHFRTHTGEKPFKCSVCNYRCVQKGYLQQHVKSHSRGYRAPLKCSICTYECVQKRSFQRHMEFHTGGIPYHLTP